MTVTELQHWPSGKPLPEGWRIAEQAPSHHGEYSVLIERIPSDAPQMAVRYDHLSGIEVMFWRRGSRDVEIVNVTPEKAMQLAHDLLGWALLRMEREGQRKSVQSLSAPNT